MGRSVASWTGATSPCWRRSIPTAGRRRRPCGSDATATTCCSPPSPAGASTATSRATRGPASPILDSDDPYNYVELRGRATIEEDVGRKFDTGLSHDYDGKDPDPDPPGAVRLIIRVEVDKATGYAA